MQDLQAGPVGQHRGSGIQASIIAVGPQAQARLWRTQPGFQGTEVLLLG